MNHIAHPPAQIIGQFRRFGPAGPVYEVKSVGKLDEAGHRWMQVHIFDSDEDVEYRLEDVLDDPEVD